MPGDSYNARSIALLDQGQGRLYVWCSESGSARGNASTLRGHRGRSQSEPVTAVAILAIARRQRLGNLAKNSQIATGESKSSPASGMACPPFCTEYKMTTGVPSFTQIMLSTELRPP